MRILLIGPNGQVGHELARTLLPLGELRTAGRPSVDLADLDTLAGALAEHRPTVIVNAAAYTAVDQAETDRETADQVNGAAVRFMAEHAAAHNAALIHFSTDYVFPGVLDRPLREDDPTDPINAYGASKALGEAAIRAAGCHHLIFRTAWVYGNHGRNFLRTMLRLAAVHPTLKIVDDQVGAPTWSRMLAELVAQALGAIAREGWQDREGTYHLSARGETTWCGFARRFIANAVGSGRLAQMPRIEAVASDAFPTPATRPAFSVLDNRRFERAFSLRVPSWEQQLDLCMQDFHQPHD